MANKNSEKIFGGLLLLGFIGHSSLLFQEPFGRALEYRGHSYFQMGYRWLLAPYCRISSLNDAFDVGAKLTRDERRYFYWGLIELELTEDGCIRDPALFLEGIYQQSREYRSFVFESRGTFLNTRFSIDAESQITSFPEETRPYVWKGWSTTPGFKHTSELPSEGKPWAASVLGEFLYAEMLGEQRRLSLNAKTNYEWPNPKLGHLRKKSKFEPEINKWVFRGLGIAHMKRNAVIFNPEHNRSMENFLQVFAPNERRQILWGVGWGVRRLFREDLSRALDWLQRLPPQYQEAADQGLQAYEVFYS